jgi:hypothetical protein
VPRLVNSIPMLGAPLERSQLCRPDRNSQYSRGVLVLASRRPQQD